MRGTLQRQGYQQTAMPLVELAGEQISLFTPEGKPCEQCGEPTVRVNHQQAGNWAYCPVCAHEAKEVESF